MTNPVFNPEVLRQLQADIAKATVNAGRNADEVRLLPVSKTFDAVVIRQAVDCGLQRFGENKVQEIKQKYPLLEDRKVEWVMIGHLQTNKVKEVAQYVTEVQSLDRLELALALEKRLQQQGRSLDVLIQVKTSPEPSKYGMPADQVASFLKEIAATTSCLNVQGLMTLAINSEDSQQVRQCFRELRELREQLQNDCPQGGNIQRLSMGMSSDYEIAIQEGATEVRVGTALFGGRYQFQSYWPESV